MYDITFSVNPSSITTNPSINTLKNATDIDTFDDEDSIVESDNSVEDLNSDYNIDNSPRTQLSQWTIKHNISNVATSDLLKILNNYYDSSLPIDARVLLKTEISNASIPLRDVLPGKYYHFGITYGVKNHYKIENNQNNNLIKLVIGIDGLPLTKSSKSTFWPILCYIRPYSNIVFPIGIYWGYDKPSDSNDFLQEFYDEIKYLISNGIEIKNKSGIIIKKQIIIDTFCCDVPAKSFILKTKGHSGFFSCFRCCTEGEFLNRRVCFPDINFSKRTHDDFINRKQEDHHVGNTLSILTSIPGIDIINVFSLDYLHLVCLGVMKKLINLWLKGPLNNRLNSTKSKLLSNNLIELRGFIPIDFQRKPRGIDEVSRWKATEFRTFLLYLGPIVLKNIVNEKCYLHFLSLHVSMFILLSKSNINNNFLDFSKRLLNYFVTNFISIYGREWVSHNVHALQHLSDDYLNFGSLNNCSTFPFENHMKVLKNYIRKSNQPLQQAVKRYTESITYGIKPTTTEDYYSFNFKTPHTEGPLTKDLEKYYNFQYKILIFNNFEIKINQECDSYLQMINGDIVKVLNIINGTNNEGLILGYCFGTKEPFYKKPINSSKLDIFIVDNLDKNLKSWSIKNIKCKSMVLKVNYNCNYKMVAFPILHTYRI